MSTIPNVSAIYRNLTHLNENVCGPYTNSEQYVPNYSLENRNRNQRNGFEELYAYKQQRHNQLMNKLKNSCQENKKLFAGGQSYQQPQYRDERKFNQGFSSNFEEPKSRFVMPKIKYRHIEDTKKPEMGKVLESTLQREFYGEKQKNESPQQKNQIQIQTQMRPKLIEKELNEEDLQSQVSFKSDRNKKFVRDSKYQDSLASYYDLCRKNIVSNKTEEPKGGKAEKFMRNEGKTQKLKLDEALKILNFD